MGEYISHLASDKYPNRTACGEPWQGWQQPYDADLSDPNLITLPPMKPPRAHQDQVRLCGACQKLIKES